MIVRYTKPDTTLDSWNSAVNENKSFFHEVYSQVPTSNCYLPFLSKKNFYSFLFLNWAHQKKNMTWAERFKVNMIAFWKLIYSMQINIVIFPFQNKENDLLVGGETRITNIKFFVSLFHFAIRAIDFTSKKQKPHKQLKHNMNR